MPLVLANVSGKEVQPSDLKVVSIERSTPQDGVAALRSTLKHDAAPLEFLVTYTAWSDTGVLSCDVELKNTGDIPVEIDRCSSLLLTLSGSPAELRYMRGPNGIERQWTTAQLDKDAFQIDNKLKGRSSPDTAQWWSIYVPSSNLSYTCQMAYSGNWRATFTPTDKGTREVAMEMVFDNDGPLTLEPGKSFKLPRIAFTVSQGDRIDDIVPTMHRFMRKYVIPKQPQNDPLLVQYNTWYAYGDNIDAEKIKTIIPLAAKIGCEAFVIDANWHYCPGNEAARWQDTLGDWEVNPKTFPDGIAPIMKLAHDHGMKFGLWFEPEVASLKSKVFREHPDWFLTYQGKPIVKQKNTRVHLDYAKPEVRERMTSVIDGLMKQGRLDWIKLDYNIDIGGEFDPAGDVKLNTRLHDHLQGYYQWLEEIAQKYPDLVIENCSSGGRRTDLGILARTHTGWISDTVAPRFSAQCAWGALIEMPPEICNHWMVGDVPPGKRSQKDATITSDDPRWWDFMFRIAMNGQYGVSSRLDLWPEAALDRAAENTKLYKRIRTVIHGADVYHLTDAPKAGYKPEGWMAIQYNRPDQDRCVVLAYRLGKSDPLQNFKLRGLDPDATYTLQADGEPALRQSGASLMRDGLNVELKSQWMSQVIELAKQDSK